MLEDDVKKFIGTINYFKEEEGIPNLKLVDEY